MHTYTAVVERCPDTGLYGEPEMEAEYIGTQTIVVT